VYDKGSAGPSDIVRGLDGICDPVFLVVDSAHVRAMLPLLRDLAPVREIAGSPAQVARALEELRLNGITTFSESCLSLTAALAAHLRLPFHGEATVRVLTDKVLQRLRLREAGVDDVRFAALFRPEDWDAAVTRTGLPAVLKPTRGEGSRNTYAVHDDGTGRRLAARLLTPGRDGDAEETAMVLEELLVGRSMAPFGDYVSVESVVSHGAVSHIGVTGKFPLREPFREAGHFWPPPLNSVEQEEVLELAGRAIAALGVRHGILHTEIKLTAAGPRLLEVNGRLGGFINEMNQLAGGVDLIGTAGRIALGERVRQEPTSTDRVVFVHFACPPLGAESLISVDGASLVRTLPGCVSYRNLATPGTLMEPGVASVDLDVLCGTANSFEDMLAFVAEARKLTRFTFLPESLEYNGMDQHSKEST
jgi:hypothetical protein